MLVQRIIDTGANLIILVGIPLVLYYAYHRRRHGRSLVDTLKRSGLCLGDPRYALYGLATAGFIAVWVALLPPDLTVITREGTVQHGFVGLGFGAESIATALLYAFIQTGFAEEFLFRGLIAGSLARRLSLWPANLLQAGIFLAPHLFLLRVMPEHWPLLVLIFLGSLFGGWLRIRSESIVGPWIIHGSANLAVTLSVLLRTGGA